jgi:fermentation-respiration switch protein FrsA (DUF1100 family)
MLTEDVLLEVDNLTLVGRLYLPNKGGQHPYPTVCICHGIPSGKPDTRDRGYPALAEGICRQGLATFIFNFRGTGASGGNLDIPGWTRDLERVIEYLVSAPDVDRARLFLLGFSGGAAVSIYVAARNLYVSSVVTCACPAKFTLQNKSDNPEGIIEHFRQIGAIRDKDFPRSVTEWLDGFEMIQPIDYVASIAPRPLLLVHGDRDEVVAVSHAYRLYDRSGEPKQLVIVDGAGHRLRQNDEVMTTVTDWIKSQAMVKTDDS